LKHLTLKPRSTYNEIIVLVMKIRFGMQLNCNDAVTTSMQLKVSAKSNN